MAVEMNATTSYCYKCGKAFSRKKGYFPVSYAASHKGIGYLHICKDCIDSMYDSYLEQCGNTQDAVRQMCRKLDVYWNKAAFDAVDKKTSPRTLMTSYLARITSVSYAGKCYDDTLCEEGTLWTWAENKDIIEQRMIDQMTKTDDDEEIEVDESVKSFWGPGYTPRMYIELEDRLKYWLSEFPEGYDLDAGTKALLRQIVILEIDINRDRASGKSVDKSINTLNNLLGSAMLKPTQKKLEDADMQLEGTPLGVWLYRYENKRPLPEVDEELKDVNKIRKYVFTWMGHLCKMLGIKNGYSKLYEDEIERLRVEKPEYDGDDEEFLMDIMSGDE